MATNDLKDVVREKYGQAASLVQKGRTSCCGTASSVANCCDPITSHLYDDAQAGEVSARWNILKEIRNGRSPSIWFHYIATGFI